MTVDPAGLPASHRDVLAAIADEHDDTPPKGSDIAEASRIETAHIYHILAELEADEYIDRQPAPHDRRARLTWLTDRGLELLEALKTQYTIEAPPTVPADNPDGWAIEVAEEIAATLATHGASTPNALGEMLETPTEYIEAAVATRSEWFEYITDDETVEAVVLTEAGRAAAEPEVSTA